MPEFEGKPKEVQEAIRNDDREKLGELGRVGGNNTQKKLRKEVEKRVYEITQETDLSSLIVTDEDGDVVPNETLTPTDTVAHALELSRASMRDEGVCAVPKRGLDLELPHEEIEKRQQEIIQRLKSIDPSYKGPSDE